MCNGYSRTYTSGELIFAGINIANFAQVLADFKKISFRENYVKTANLRKIREFTKFNSSKIFVGSFFLKSNSREN